MQRLLDRLGRIVFRLRSLLPLPLIYLVVVTTWDDHLTPGPGGPKVDALLDVVGIAVCLLGSAWRFFTVASVPDGTSTQSRRMQSNALNTEGLYAVVRHPLYLGNLFITLGLLLVANEPVAYAVGLGYWLITHALIVRGEEQLLRRTFPEAWPAWAARTSRWWPDLTKLSSLRGPFAWKRALQREVNPLVAWGCGATVILLWERFVRSQLPTSLGKQYLGIIASLLVLLIVNKVWKKRRRS